MKTSKMVVKESNSIIHSEEIKKRTVIAIQIIRETKGGDDGECRARRRTTVGWRPPRTTTQPCARQRDELVFLFVWIAIITNPTIDNAVDRHARADSRESERPSRAAGETW